MSIWVRSLPLPRSLGYSPSSRRRLRLGKGQPLISFLRFGWYDIAGHCRRRTIPQYHRIVLPRRATVNSVRVFYHPVLPPFLQPVSLLSLAHSRASIIVYDMSS